MGFWNRPSKNAPTPQPGPDPRKQSPGKLYEEVVEKFSLSLPERMIVLTAALDARASSTNGS